MDHVRSPDQELAWKKFIHWINAEKTQEFRLGGLAGTGKTSLIKSMVRQMGSAEVIAPTAKAAEVLNKKGVPAKTCHSVLCRFEYETVNESGKTVPVFSDKKTSRDFMIVDEASMITESMRQKILKCGKRVVWVGDYGQLPPVDPDGVSGCIVSEENLDAKLIEQHRHSESEGIIDFAMYLRNGGSPQNYDYSENKNVKVNPDGINTFRKIVGFTVSNNLWPVICYRNVFITAFNNEVRAIKGFKNPLEPGLKIVCTYNNYKWNVVNGEMFTIASVLRNGEILTECGKRFTVSFQKNRSDVVIQDGYAITCHKAQGSEWPHIAVIEDLPASPEWRYTAVTRAQKNIVYFTD